VGNERIKIGIIGTGAIATHCHIPAYQALPEVEIIGVADANETRAKETARKFGIPHAFADYRELLELEGLRAVSVCSPNAFHAEQSIAAMEAGLAVLCEKPMSTILADAQKMVATSRRTQSLLMIGMTTRFHEHTQALRRQVGEGLLGDVYYIKAGWLRRTGIPGYGSWFTNKDLAGGGALLDIGVHYLDIALWTAGFPTPISVSGKVFTKFGNRRKGLGTWGADICEGEHRFDVDDLATAFVRLDNGAVLTLEVSWAAYVAEQGERYLKLMGTEGGAEISSRFANDAPLRLFWEQDGLQADTSLHVKVDEFGHWREIAHFIACVKGETEPLVTLDESLIVAKVLDAIYRSAETGAEVTIE